MNDPDYRQMFRERLKTMQWGETAENYSRRCGIPVPTLRKYLSGDRFPGGDHLYVLAKNLRVTVDWLLGGNLSSRRLVFPDHKEPA